MIWAKSLLMLVVATTLLASPGCYHTQRLPDHTALPASPGLGDGLPSAAKDSKTCVKFDSLYVHRLSTPGTVSTRRFWPDGSALFRFVKTNAQGTVDAESGSFDGVGLTAIYEWSMATNVGKYRIVDDRVYIETFEFRQVWQFVMREGRLTDSGFTLDRQHYRSHPMDPNGALERIVDAIIGGRPVRPEPWTFERVHVGPMRGEPFW